LGGNLVKSISGIGLHDKVDDGIKMDFSPMFNENEKNLKKKKEKRSIPHKGEPHFKADELIHKLKTIRGNPSFPQSAQQQNYEHVYSKSPDVHNYKSYNFNNVT